MNKKGKGAKGAKGGNAAGENAAGGNDDLVESLSSNKTKSEQAYKSKSDAKLKDKNDSASKGGKEIKNQTGGKSSAAGKEDDLFSSQNNSKLNVNLLVDVGEEKGAKGVSSKIISQNKGFQNQVDADLVDDDNTTNTNAQSSSKIGLKTYESQSKTNPVKESYGKGKAFGSSQGNMSQGGVEGKTIGASTYTNKPIETSDSKNADEMQQAFLNNLKMMGSVGNNMGNPANDAFGSMSAAPGPSSSSSMAESAKNKNIRTADDKEAHKYYDMKAENKKKKPANHYKEYMMKEIMIKDMIKEIMSKEIMTIEIMSKEIMIKEIMIT